MEGDIISKQRIDGGVVMLIEGFDGDGDDEWIVAIDLDGEKPWRRSFTKYLSAMEYASGYISGYNKAQKRFGKRGWF